MKKAFGAFIAILSTISFSSNAQTNTLPTTGSVGIGTTSPGALLEVAKTSGFGEVMRVSNSTANYPFMTFYTSGSRTSYIGHGGNDGNFLIQAQTGAIQFFPNNSLALTLNTSGNVGIGTPSPGTALDVLGTAPILRARSSTSQSAWVGLQPLGDGTNDVAIVSNWASGASKLHFQLGQSQGSQMTITNGGNVGIGTTSPGSLFELKSTAPILTINGTDNAQFKGINFATNGSVQANILSNINTGELKFQSGTTGFGGFITFNLDGTEKMRVQSNTGNVGIGTSAPDEKLTVYGKIHSQEVKVDLSVPGPDYVFEPTYKLPTLSDIKTFVDKNHHLPEIPTAADMAKNGIDLGDMNTKLLKKVEELTLYLIEKDKKEQQHEKRIKILEKQIKALRKH